MKTQLSTQRNNFLAGIFIMIFFINANSQNYSIPQTIDYINNISDSKYTLEFSNNKFILKKLGWVDHRTKKTRQWEIYGEIHLSDISKISVGEPISWSGESCYSCVSFHCKANDNCAKIYFAYPKYGRDPNILWDLGNNGNAEKVANALRYIIEKAKKSTTINDPFSKYGQETKDYSTLNISELNIGMSKQNVFSILNTKPVVESIETGYEVYKVKRNADQYFLYFSKNKLIRVDKGVSIYDAIILIE